jgi:hypothetical protein
VRDQAAQTGKLPLKLCSSATNSAPRVANIGKMPVERADRFEIVHDLKHSAAEIQWLDLASATGVCDKSLPDSGTNAIGVPCNQFGTRGRITVCRQGVSRTLPVREPTRNVAARRDNF